MWFDPVSATVYTTHSDIRADYPQVSFPREMTENNISALGLVPVTAISPDYNPATQVAEETTPVKINGQWTQQWVIRDLTPAELKARVPTVVTMRQARLALLQSNLLSQVEAAIAAIEDAVQRQAVQIEWEYAAEVDMTHPWVQALATALGLTDDELDALFVQAATL